MARRTKPVPYSKHTQCSAGCRQSISHAMQRTHHCHSWQVQYVIQWHGCLAPCGAHKQFSAGCRHSSLHAMQRAHHRHSWQVQYARLPCGAHTQCSVGCRQNSPHAMQCTHHRHFWQVQYTIQWHRVQNHCLAARTRSAAPDAVRASHMQCSVRITDTHGRCSTHFSGTALMDSVLRNAHVVLRPGDVCD